MNINPNHYTANQHPGKFEMEIPATEYFYEQMMEGCGETIFADLPNYDDVDEPSAETFKINAEESEAFNLPIGHIFMIREDSQGFVYGSVHETREAAEKKFREWLGVSGWE